MADEDSKDNEDKTEDPSAHKLEEARKKGQIFSSKEVQNWLMMLAILITILMFSNFMFENSKIGLRSYLEKSHMWALDIGNLQGIFFSIFLLLMKILGPTFILIIFLMLVGHLTQTGMNFSSEHLMPKLERISFIKGLGRLFSLRSLIEFLKSLLKITVTGAIAMTILWPALEHIDQYIGLEAASGLIHLRFFMVKLVIALLCVIFIIAVADYLYQRYDYLKNLKMTKQELKEEFKQTEGDPHMKAHIKQIRQEKSRRRMMAEVPKATVIIANPTHYSIALLYDQKAHKAPIVIAKGIDHMALKIREIANEHRIPIVTNPPLAQGLYKSVDLDQEIPEEYYKATAKIISYVYGLKNKKLN